MMRAVNRIAFPRAALALLAIAGAASAGEKPWFRYDNRYFTAYSNASERAARNPLEDLEEFRAAVMQVGNIAIPADAPKTIVVITATAAEFDRLKTGKHVAGFASRQGDRTVIVMPATGGEDASTTIRHEYGHALLRYKKFAYPTWYEEGFAEMASAVVLKRGGDSFVVGQPPARAVFNGQPVYPWEELFSEEFDPHALTDLRAGSSAYAQAWIMAHYATLGENGANAKRLQAYFNMLKEGEPALSAFDTAFGFAPADAWDAVLHAYSSHIPVYTFKFRPGSLEREFARRPADDGEIRPMLTYFERVAVALYRPTPPPDPRAALAGRWGDAHLAPGCERFMSLNVAGDEVSVVVGDGDTPDPAAGMRFRLQQDAADSATFLLSPIETAVSTAADDDVDNSPKPKSMAVSLRSRDIACWWREKKGPGCGRILTRCD